MGAALRYKLAENYEAFSTLMSKSETGGLLNYFLEPRTNGTTGEVYLEMANPDVLDVLKEYFLTSKVQTRVLDVLPDDVKPDTVKGPQYMGGMIAGGLAIVLSILFFLSIFIIPCVFRCGKRRSKKGFSQCKSIAYLVIGAITGVLLLGLALAIPFTLVASESFVDVMKGNQTTEGKSELAQRLDRIFSELGAFVEEMPARGAQVTNETLASIQKAVQEEVAPLVENMGSGLMRGFGADKIENGINSVEFNIEFLKNTTSNIHDKNSELEKSIEGFKTTMNEHKKQLENSRTYICGTTRSTKGNECQNMKEAIAKMDFDSVPSDSLNKPIQMLSDVAKQIEATFQNISKNIDDLKNKTREGSQELAKTLEEKLQFEEQFGSLNSIWKQLQEQLQGPLGEMNQSVPDMSQFTKLGGIVGTAVGFTFTAVFALTVVIMMIYLVLCGIDAARQSFWPCGSGDGGKPIRKCPCCGFLLPALLSILTPIIIIIAVLLVLVTSVANNEGCRYVTKPSAIRVSSATLDLYLKNKLTDLVQSSGDQMNILNPTVPRGTLEGILIKCKPSAENKGQPQLLPILGMSNIVNVSAVMEHETLQKAIAEGKSQAITSVKDLKLHETLPNDIQETVKNMSKIARNISVADYKNLTTAVEIALPEKKELESKLLDIKNQVPEVSGTDEDEKMKQTIDKMISELSSLDKIKTTIADLSDAFTGLSEMGKFSDDLNTLAVDLGETLNKINADTQIETIITAIYDETVKKTLNNLTDIFEEKTEYFTQNVMSCGRVNTAMTTAVGVGCGPEGIFSRLGAYMFMLLLVGLPLLFTIFLFQIFLGLHMEQCDADF